MAEDRNETQASLVQAEIQGDGAPQSPAAQPKPHTPYRRVGFFLLLLCAFPIPFLTSFVEPGLASRLYSMLADVGLLLFGLFFAIGEWKSARKKRALLVLCFEAMVFLGFLLHLQTIML